MDRVIRGRSWCFGDHVDTDQMAPWSTMGMSFEERRSRILPTRPGWADRVQPGDVVIAGANWGCGSSRETAPENLQQLGIAAVVADSFGRIYFRNSIALAFPHLVCPGVREIVTEGDRVEIDLGSAIVTNLATGASLTGEPYSPEMLEILEAGGLIEVLTRRWAELQER